PPGLGRSRPHGCGPGLTVRTRHIGSRRARLRSRLTRSPRGQRQYGIGHNARMETPRPAAAAEFLPPPAAGRVFTAGYPIRRTDVTPGGRLRLDALARYLQDVAEDDVADSGLREPYAWLVRRCALANSGYQRRGPRLRLAT